MQCTLRRVVSGLGLALVWRLLTALITLGATPPPMLLLPFAQAIVPKFYYDDEAFFRADRPSGTVYPTPVLPVVVACAPVALSGAKG